MKLSIVIPVYNQHPLSLGAIQYAIKNLSGERDVEMIILDNGSEKPFNPYGRAKGWVAIQNPVTVLPNDKTTGDAPHIAKIEVKTIRLEKNIGVYPTFWEALKYASGDVIAYLHSDLIICEKGWDKRVMEAFQDEKMGLIGFIGSKEIDSSGGRGRGTTSNFQGLSMVSRDEMGKDREWKGSPAGAHGKTNSGYTRAAVVDGCAMVFARKVLEKIKQRENFPPHHFYDRLLSCETRENGWVMGVLGIGCDHISGQTVNQEPGYAKMAEEWATAHGFTMEGVHNWDSVLYREAEKQWLTEYRDKKHLVPVVV